MSNFVIPISGNTYIVQNAGLADTVGHVLDNAFGNTSPGTNDGNPILSWSRNNPETNNQIWTYLTYPSSSNETVFTLQSVGAVNHEPEFGGRGGYIRVNETTQQLVQGGAPLAWKLVPAPFGNNTFKMIPFDDVISNNGSLLATDINPKIISPADNTAQLVAEDGEDTQFWQFIPQDPID